MAQLEKEEYEQLRYAKLELLRCPVEIFKMIIKTHNRMKVEKHRGVSFLEIDQLIKEFSEEKRFNEVEFQELKFELIDKNSLTSQEYKEIFLDDVKRKKTGEYCSMIRMEDSNKQSLSTRDTAPFMSSRLTESLITPSMISPMNSGNPSPLGNLNPGIQVPSMQKMNDELTLEMENTWEKKKNEELKA